jgi:hypothetical protein
MPNIPSSFRIAGAATPGATGASSDAFGGVLKGWQMPSTMTPPNPQDNFLGLGLTKEEALKADPTQLMLFGMQANRQQEQVYNDPSRLQELMGVYGEFRSQEAAKAQQMKLQSQAFQGLLDIPKTIASAYATVPAMYLAGRERGGFGTIPRRVAFQ